MNTKELQRELLKDKEYAKYSKAYNVGYSDALRDLVDHFKFMKIPVSKELRKAIKFLK